MIPDDDVWSWRFDLRSMIPDDDLRWWRCLLCLGGQLDGHIKTPFDDHLRLRCVGPESPQQAVALVERQPQRDRVTACIGRQLRCRQPPFDVRVGCTIANGHLERMGQLLCSTRRLGGFRSRERFQPEADGPQPVGFQRDGDLVASLRVSKPVARQPVAFGIVRRMLVDQSVRERWRGSDRTRRLGTREAPRREKMRWNAERERNARLHRRRRHSRSDLRGVHDRGRAGHDGAQLDQAPTGHRFAGRHAAPPLGLCKSMTTACLYAPSVDGVRPSVEGSDGGRFTGSAHAAPPNCQIGCLVSASVVTTPYG